jgi:hypothetical protein
MSGILNGVTQPLVTAGAGKIPLSEFAKLRQGKVKPTLTSTGAASAVTLAAGGDEAGATPTAGTHDVSQAGGVSVNGVHYMVAPPPPPGSVFYANQNAYVFFRLHQYVCDRLTTARLLCARGRQLKQKEGKVLRHPTDRKAEDFAAMPQPGQVAGVMGTTATAVAQAAGAAAREAAARTGSTGASVAASHGDLTDVAAAAVHATIDGGDVPMSGAGSGSGSEGDVRQNGTYQLFLTSVYGAIDGSMDTSRYEDECRELMGTLCVSAAKQLQMMVKETTTPGLTQKLIQHWMYAQAKVAYAVHKANTAAEGAYTLWTVPRCLRL